MKPIEQALQTLIKRDPTPDEVAQFYKVKEICGFSEHDSVWALLLAFGHYEILYGEIPGKITEQTVKLLADHKLSLEAAAEAAERAVRGSMIENVTKTTRDMADRAIEAGKVIASHEHRRKLIFAVLGAFALSVAAAGALAWGAYKAGERSGAVGAMLDAAWAQSPDGRAARTFAQLNNMQGMLDCAPNYQTHKEGSATYCIPYDESTRRTFGWRIK
ncbi:hypothetical protein [Paraburkholderia sacchari]|uniref:hypothetical protein n=1 Tax=Paraburkholderia sacchari TaxID=159450 RepID=UPI0005428E5C|nr:hypothetical protein [Paraburkholderia sacchari]NLP65560.1 hypothetical protein [Paraburkholderia sacchari]